MKTKPNRHERKRRAIQRARSANRARANRERLARLHRRFAEAMRPAQELWAKILGEPRHEKMIGTLRPDYDPERFAAIPFQSYAEWRIEILERRLDPCEACSHVHPPDRRCVFARAAYGGRVEECGCAE